MKTFTPKRSEEEIRAQQDQKNEQDWKYDVGQKIQSLNDRLKVLAEIQKQYYSKSHSETKSVEINFENLRDLVLHQMNQINQKIGNIESKVLVLTEALKDLELDTHIKFTELEYLREDMTSEALKLAELQQETERKDLYLDSCICNLRKHFKNELDSAKEEMLPKPPEVDPVKKQLDERFQVFKVDFDGITKEISILKQAARYGEKKFENVYTLIERLKEGKQ